MDSVYLCTFSNATVPIFMLIVQLGDYYRRPTFLETRKCQIILKKHGCVMIFGDPGTGDRLKSDSTAQGYCNGLWVDKRTRHDTLTYLDIGNRTDLQCTLLVLLEPLGAGQVKTFANRKLLCGNTKASCFLLENDPRLPTLSMDFTIGLDSRSALFWVGSEKGHIVSLLH